MQFPQARSEGQTCPYATIAYF